MVDSHPGLQFLQEAVDFHSRYIHCVSVVVSSLGDDRNVVICKKTVLASFLVVGLLENLFCFDKQVVR